jgi:HlyD family secretion protein
VLIEQWGGPETLHGRVRRIEPAGFTKVSALGVEEQRVNVIIEFDAETEAARALGDGYRVEVRIVLWRGDAVLTVPTGSLFRAGDGWAVYRVEGGRAHRRAVTIGQRTAQQAQVTAGLEAGAAVVLYPSDTLEDGVRVVVR